MLVEMQTNLPSGVTMTEGEEELFGLMLFGIGIVGSLLNGFPGEGGSVSILSTHVIVPSLQLPTTYADFPSGVNATAVAESVQEVSEQKGIISETPLSFI